MKQRTVYLAGPMEHVSKEDAAGWREEATKRLEMAGCVVLNPCRRLHSFRKEEMKSIFELDLRDIDESDIVLAHLDNLKEIPRHGTAMEVFYAAHVRRIQVVAFKSTQNDVHPFFEALVTEWRSTADKAVDTIISKYL